MPALSAPLFQFGDMCSLPATDIHLRDGFAGVSFALTGPGATAEPGHLPVRGDLAHINMAGRYFVPHYVVPQPRRIAAAGTGLRKAGKADADVIEVLAAGTVFNVLDISGGWAWGQVGDQGFVGYVELAHLSEAEQ